MPKATRQAALFEQSEDRAAGGALVVASVMARAKPQDRQQAAFQRLIKQIHDHRIQIEEWQSYRTRYNQRVAVELTPIYADMRRGRLAMAYLLDRQFEQRGAIRGKKPRQRLREMIRELTSDLLGEEHDADIEALHDKHGDLSHAEQAELEKAFSHDMIENIFGVRLDAEDENEAASMEEMIARAMRQLQHEEEQRPRRRKSAKAAAAEEKRLEAEKQASQSVREVYRKLASTLHPDRSGADLTAAEKTALMQRVNRAYDKGDLLELLNIQLEIEQIDDEHLANLSAGRVAHYNQVLREQLAELKSEMESLLMPYRPLCPYTRNLRPVHVDMAMDQEIVRLKNNLRQLEADLAAFQDASQLAIVLKNYRPDDGLDEFEAFGALLDGLPVSPPPRSRRKR